MISFWSKSSRGKALKKAIIHTSVGSLHSPCLTPAIPALAMSGSHSLTSTTRSLDCLRLVPSAPFASSCWRLQPGEMSLGRRLERCGSKLGKDDEVRRGHLKWVLLCLHLCRVLGHCCPQHLFFFGKHCNPPSCGCLSFLQSWLAARSVR